MDRSKIHEKAKTIEIKAKTKKEFFLLHGYTGSPTDFNELGKYLNKKFNANVKIIRLIGHGQKIENLSGLEYKDFFQQAEKELKKDIEKGRKIIIGGISVGSLVALHLASKYPVRGVLNVSVPYKNKFITKIISFLEPIILKKIWTKPIPDCERELRKKAFFYDTSISGLRVIKHGKKELKHSLKNITAPSLIIHVSSDYIFHPKGAELITKKISSKIKEFVLFETEKKASHNPFYTKHHKRLYKLFEDFIKKNKLFD